MGSGLYAQKLTYKQWFDFNNAQRAHYNLIEIAPSAFIFLLIAGVYFPIPAAIIGLALVFARAIYSIGYVKGGPKGRIFGGVLNSLCLLGLLGLGVASAVKLINGETI
jgi:glutathione S-transferase